MSGRVCIMKIQQQNTRLFSTKSLGILQSMSIHFMRHFYVNNFQRTKRNFYISRNQTSAVCEDYDLLSIYRIYLFLCRSVKLFVIFSNVNYSWHSEGIVLFGFRYSLFEYNIILWSVCNSNYRKHANKRKLKIS